jgi:signal peptidase I
MSFFLNEERSAYRKWINVLTSLLLPGSAHVLSGRKVAGVNWFLANLAVGLLSGILLLILHAELFVVVGLILLIRVGFRILTSVDSCKKPISRLSFAKWLCVAAAIVFLPFLMMFTGWQLCFRSFYIPTAAMEPTLMGERRTRDGQILARGDHVIVERFPYIFHPPRRGDLAVFRTEAINAGKREAFRIPADEVYVKRIVGLPGERVLVQPHSITINGQKLIEPKIFETLMAQTNVNPNAPPGYTIPSSEVQLGPDEYYVLGDNILNSLDSRYYGGIKSGHFAGKVLLIFWPADRRGFVQ